MKKLVLLAVAAVMAFTLTSCGGEKLTVEGTSSDYSNDELKSAAQSIREHIGVSEETDFEFQFLGDISYGDSIKSVKIYKYKHGEDTNDISGEYLTFSVKMQPSKTASAIVEAVRDNPFDIDGFKGYFSLTYIGNSIVKRNENGEWEYVCDDLWGFDFEDTAKWWKSDIYSRDERVAAVNAMHRWFDENEGSDSQMLDIRYVGDESASKEELDKLNKSKGTDYDGCMKMHADLYSAEKADIVKDTEWLVARQNGEWEVVEYDLHEASTAE